MCFWGLREGEETSLFYWYIVGQNFSHEEILD